MYALPLTAGASPVGSFEFLVAGPGDQVDPAIDGQYVVYSGPGPVGNGLDVYLHDIQAGTTQVVAGGTGDQDSPDVYFGTAVYREPAGIIVKSWVTGQVLREPPPGGDGPVSNPVVHSAIAAWEQQDPLTGADVVVSLPGGAPYVLRSPGDADPLGNQHSPAVYDGLVAYVDDARGGAVYLHDSGKGPSNWTLVCSGRATGVAIGKEGGRYVVTVARSSGPTGEDIEVYDRDGVLLAALPAAGTQHNPHISAEWVAFDDHSGPFSQVVVWRWTPPGDLVFLPRPTQTDQRLNDVSLVGADELRVVFEDTASPATGRDIALYRLPVNPIVFDGRPNGWPIVSAPPPPPPSADCSDPTAPALATLELSRAAGAPDHGSVRFDFDPPPGEDELPVLVCIHAEHVSSAWVVLGDDLVARPDDFEPHTVELSKPARVEEGEAHLFARLTGKPGARLVVRVLPDPSRGACDDDDDDGDDYRDDHGDRDHDDRVDDRRDDHVRDGDRHDDHDRKRDHTRRRCDAGAGGPDASGGPGPAAALPRESRSGGCGNPGALLSLASLVALVARRRPKT